MYYTPCNWGVCMSSTAPSSEYSLTSPLSLFFPFSHPTPFLPFPFLPSPPPLPSSPPPLLPSPLLLSFFLPSSPPLSYYPSFSPPPLSLFSPSSLSLSFPSLPLQIVILWSGAGPPRISLPTFHVPVIIRQTNLHLVRWENEWIWYDIEQHSYFLSRV